MTDFILSTLQGECGCLYEHGSTVQPTHSIISDLFILIQVDHSGKVSDGEPNRMLNAAAFMIHSAIHASRRTACAQLTATV
jgi:hypothetical protein